MSEPTDVTIPTWMRAIVQDEYGDAEMLRTEQVPVPSPGPGEVLVRVHAAGIDMGVWHLMTGRPLLLRLFGFGLQRPKLRGRGRDLAGTIVALGAGVEGLQAGDVVFGTADAAFADHAVTRADRLLAAPRGVPLSQLAALPTSGSAALHGLRDAGRLQRGQRVLVIGAGGGVGSFAIQLAVAAGAHVTAVCSAAKAGLARSLGAEAVIDYRSETLSQAIARGVERFDLVLEIAGERTIRELRAATVPGGAIVLAGGEGGGSMLGGVAHQLRGVLTAPFVRQRIVMLVSAERPTDLAELAAHLVAGTVVSTVDAELPLERVPDALRRLARGGIAGKLVIRVSDDPVDAE
ncbi:NAD(P)-dependent alcohol dehydrogenase [Plantibacter sp. RU18]|uniref:NAD(P)-dependent alcohol dehydrogenase n=1 Tax=Plantibacter sp. RU18 TaxID=3158143 RepID=UPI003D35D034